MEAVGLPVLVGPVTQVRVTARPAEHLLPSDQGLIPQGEHLTKRCSQQVPRQGVRRGWCAEAKYLLGDEQGACTDYKKAVSLGSQLAAQWLNSEKGEWCRNMK